MGPAGDLSGALVADKYELLRLLGRGGMGAVYEARNVSTLKRCAVKVLLSPELAGDNEVVKRFFREARASGLIESDHVVAAFDSGIDAAERAYYVMECLQGEDLEQTLDRLQQLSPMVAVKIILQAASGLASAHALGIVHRDVKPANLFLAEMPNGEIKVKILDFGVAKVKMEVFNESSNTLTHSGSLLGTPLYMSPEQLRRASAIDESADIWSLGVVLFECLTGQLPWGDCDGIGELVTAILTQRVPHVQDLAPWVRPDLAEILQRALSRDPGQRLRSAAELRDAMQRLIGSDTRLYAHEIAVPNEDERSSRAPRASLPDTVMLGPTPHSGMPVVTALSTAPPARRRPWLAALGAGTLLGVAAWSFTAGRAPKAQPGGVTHALAAAPSVSATFVSAVVSAPPAVQHFALEVGPPGARVAVDGAFVATKNGQILISGLAGTALTVRVELGSRSTEQRVAITNDGLVPSRLVLASVVAPTAPRRDAPTLTKPIITEPAPTLPAATQSGPKLSEQFE